MRLYLCRELTANKMGLERVLTGFNFGNNFVRFFSQKRINNAHTQTHDLMVWVYVSRVVSWSGTKLRTIALQ